MPEPSDGSALDPAARLHHRLERVALASRLAAAIYGLIVSGAVMAAAGEHGSVRDVAITVFITVLVYWAAESYADVLGEQIAEARPSTWARSWELLRQGWPLVEASYVPLIVLVVAWAVGASTTGAITAGLVTNALFLVALGWIASAQTSRSVPVRIASAALAGAFGMVMIAIKTILH
jgi:hypothetical protein